MPDIHGEVEDEHETTMDPHAAPLRLEVRERFSSLQIAIVWALGAVAIVAGLIVGLTVTNS
jgi:hypothetical protein